MAGRRTLDQPLAPQQPSLPEPFASRTPQAAQVRAPQIADAPRAQSGEERRLDDPQPLVAAPVRQGTGAQLPSELGTIRAADADRVAVRPASPSATRSLTPRTSADGTRSGAVEPSPAMSPAGTARLERSTTAAVPTPAVRLPALGSLAIDAAAENARPAGAPAVSAPSLTPSRATSLANLPVPVTAPPKVGGLATNLAPDLGTPNRPASPESQIVRAGPARMLARKSGGPLAIDGRTREPAEAFARRGGMRSNNTPDGGEMSARTEAAIELGLVFLAQHQRDDGSWSLHFAADSGVDDPPPVFRAETAATGLALLAFLGAGYDHYGGTYADAVQRALDNLVKNQRANGDLYVPEDSEQNRSAWLYSHGIAAIALCEAYGMTGDPALAEPAQKAIDFIVASQDPRRGAWRYVPGNGSDTSVSGWQLMALKSGELAGLKVPPAAYDKIKQWLDRARSSDRSTFTIPAQPTRPNNVMAGCRRLR